MKTHKTVLLLAAGVIAITSIWLIYAFIRLDHPVEKWGVFGDKFGALNCLFTGLALAALVATFWHEREQSLDREREHVSLLKAMGAQNRAMCHTARVAAIECALSHAVRRLEGLRDQNVRSVPIEDKKQELRDTIKRLESALNRAIETTEFL